MKASTPKVFISRDLSDSSPLHELAGKLEVIHESLLSFSTVRFDHVPETEWVFFYSQQGVKYLLNQEPGAVIGRRVAAFGPKTSESLRNRGLVVHFTGTGAAELTAKSFSMVAKNERVLFARAQHSRMSLQKLLLDRIQVFDLVVYNNKPQAEISIPYCDALVFTSPLNAKTYFTHYQVNLTQKVFAIGQTTQTTLQELGVSNVEVSDEPTEFAITQMLRKHFAL